MNDALFEINRDCEEAVLSFAKNLVDQGRIVEAGWATFYLMVLLPSVSRVQADEMRVAFMAGAQYLWACLRYPGEPISDSDSISRELDCFYNEMMAKIRSSDHGVH